MLYFEESCAFTFPMCFYSDVNSVCCPLESRSDSAMNLTTNGLNSISMSLELNGVVYTGEDSVPM